MARIFKTPFGAQGDTEQVPEAPQGDGSVSLTQGFGYDYEREYEDPAAKDIRREVMNGLFHDITEAIGDIQLSGVAKWSADAAPYPAGAVVWNDSVAWVSTAGNNSVEPSEGASWSRLPTTNEISSGYVPQSRTITAGTGLSGGGSLAANRTLSVNYGTTAGTAAQGNDSRLSDAREWSASTVSQSEAQAGTSTTRRAWTAQRVHEAFGAFGLGGLVPTLPGDTLNYPAGTIKTGFYRFSSETEGAPPGEHWGTVICTRRASGGGEVQIAIVENTNRIYVRGRATEGWPAWERVVNSSDLGTMASLTAGTAGTSFRNNSQNDDRFAFNARTISAGTGLVGGGDLSTDRTISLGDHSADLLKSGTVNLARLPIGTGNNGIASYTTTSDAGNVNYAVGTYVVAMRDGYSTLPNRSDGRTVYKSSNGQEFTLDSSNATGSPLTGVWHSRGRINDSDSANQAFLMQRIG